MSRCFSYSKGTDIAFNVVSLSIDAFRYNNLFRKSTSDVPGSFEAAEVVYEPTLSCSFSGIDGNGAIAPSA
jgi:hypothetical protein